MTKPRILVLTAAGKTGMPITLQLLSEGFPVTAFVHRHDEKSKFLKSKGATIVAGSITNLNDMKKAMVGVQRAYFCVPMEEGNLRAATVFATVANETKLEHLVTMSQWLSSPNHPSLHTRETWLADRIFEQLPDTSVTTINPGFFADNDLVGLPFAAQFGLLMLPYGSGKNAPPSNEDLARVVAEILARPENHVGKTYRPTGPKLLSPQDLATILSKVLGHKVRYVDAPIGIFSKVAKGMGQSDFVIAQYQQYVLEYQKNTFAINAPTDVVRSITGKEPEDFETIARRYVAFMPKSKRNLGSQLRLIASLTKWMMLPAPDTVPHLAHRDFSGDNQISLSIDSSEWLQSHDLQKLFKVDTATSPGILATKGI